MSPRPPSSTDAIRWRPLQIAAVLAPLLAFLLAESTWLPIALAMVGMWLLLAIDSRWAVGAALALLAVSLGCLLAGRVPVANDIARCAYLYLVIGVGSALIRAIATGSGGVLAPDAGAPDQRAGRRRPTWPVVPVAAGITVSVVSAVVLLHLLRGLLG